MPTLLVLDLSHSMSRKVHDTANGEFTSLQLAIRGVNVLLDYLSVSAKLEYVALIAFSSGSEADVLCPFTRDYDLVKSKLRGLRTLEKTNFGSLFHTLNRLVLNEWEIFTHFTILLWTDGCQCFPLAMGSIEHQKQPTLCFPRKMTMILLHPECDNPAKKECMTSILHAFDKNGTLLCLPNLPTLELSDKFFLEVARDQRYAVDATLKFGSLSCKVQMISASSPCKSFLYERMYKNFISNAIEVCGFIDYGYIGTPTVVARHLMIAASANSDGANHKVDAEEEVDETKTPSLCVVLHAAMKVENKVGLCHIDEDWFGVLFSWTDARKRSNLILNLFEPGCNAVPWLGNFHHLGVLESGEDHNAEDELPVMPSEKRSYNQNIITWVKENNLHSDVQKIMRHARKLPEKTTHFYKELNRVRRAALAFGFVEFLDNLANIFDRERAGLPLDSHPECALQLSHASIMLRKTTAKDHQSTITALKTKYN